MRVLLIGLALLTLACGSDSGTGPVGLNLDGKWVLKTVDNKALPVAFADSSLLSGEIVISDSAWSQVSVVLYKAGGSANGDTLKLNGRWVALGNDLTLFDNSNSTQYTGTYTGTAINLNTKTATLLSYAK
jgi:hypothetical protein